MNSINIQGRLLDLRKPKLMGILNVTPDSFYAGSRVQKIDAILMKAQQQLDEGATFLDVGGYSSRPGAKDIPEEEEMKRVVEPIQEITHAFPQAIVSIDTFRSKVARGGVEAGAHMINDISGGHLDPEIIPVAGELKVPFIGMHMKGSPQTMKHLAQYDDLLTEMAQYFSEMLERAYRNHVKDVIIDPGFGFAKNVTQNFQLLGSLDYFKFLEKPMLVGVSRKSMIHRTLGITADESLNGTTVLNTTAILKGASILRVHDVKEAKEVIELTQRIEA